jgi:hypothetical protein
MKQCARTFFQSANDNNQPFFLYVGFGTTSRRGARALFLTLPDLEDR